MPRFVHRYAVAGRVAFAHGHVFCALLIVAEHFFRNAAALRNVHFPGAQSRANPKIARQRARRFNRADNGAFVLRLLHVLRFLRPVGILHRRIGVFCINRFGVLCCRIHVRHGNRFAILRRSFPHVYDARISVLRARQGAFRVHRRISLRRFLRRLLGDFSRSGGTLIHYALHGFLTRMLHRRFPHVFQRCFRDLLLRFKFRNRLFVFFDHLHFPGHVVNRLLHHTVQLRVGGVLQELRVNVLHVLPRRVLFGHCAGKVFRRCTHVFLRLLQGHFVGFHAVQRTVGDHLAHRVRNRVFRNPLRNVRAHRFCNLSAFGDKAVQRFGSNVSFRELTNLRRRAFRTGKRAVCNRPDGFRKVRSMLRRRVDYLLHCKHSLAAAHFVHKRLPGRARRFHVHSAELHHARNGGRLACIAALQRLGQRSQFLICRHVEIYGVLLRSRAGFRVRNRVIIIGCIFI